MSSGDAKTYLSKRNVPALFECLMTGLMFHRPSDHIQYLIECLEKVRAKGQDELRWNMFIEMQRSKTPLPPITPSNGRRPISRERSMTPKEEKPAEPRTATPLPPIGDRGIPDVPIIFLMGGPGSGKSTQAELLLQKYPGWVTIATGDLLRQEVASKGAADAKWKMVSDLMSKGELVPEDLVVTLLLANMRTASSAKGFIIQGFPRDMEQAFQYDRLVGRVDAVFLLDCEEETLSKQLLERAKDEKRIDNNVNTIAKRIQAYKEKTLPVLKHYDDMDKLFILEGEKEVHDIAEDLAIVFETVVGSKGRLSPAPPKEPKPKRVRSGRSGKTTPTKTTPTGSRSPEPSAAPAPEEEDAAPLPAHLMPPEVKVKDEGRKPDLPKAPIIFFAGGPASGKGTQCKRLLSRYTNAVHLSMGDIIRAKISTEGTADEKWDMVTDLLRKGDLAPEEVTVDLLVSALKEKPDAHFYLLEGFPRNLEQLEDFNKHIGGQSFTILLDCEESILHYRLSKRGKESERIDDNLVAIGKKLTFFKNYTLPIMKTFEDDGKLVVVNGDRDEDEIFFDLCKAIDFAIYGKLPELPTAAESKEPVKEEVIEAGIVPATATTTGDSVANPSYTAELDAPATEAQKSEGAEPAAESGKGETTTTTTTTQDAPKEEASPAEGDSQKAETGEAKASDAEPAKDTPADDSSKTEEAAKPEEAAGTTPEESPKEETAATTTTTGTEEAAKSDDSPKEEEASPKTEEGDKSEEASKTDDAAKSDESPKEEGGESIPADAAAAETAPAEEAPKTETGEEGPGKTEEAEEPPKAEEAAKPEEEAPKPDEDAKTEGEATAEATAEAPSGEASGEEKPAAEKEGGDAATDAAEENTGDAEPAQ